MSKILAIVFIVAGLGIILTYQNCGSPQSNKASSQEPVTITGVVEKSNLDGCHNLIVSDSDPNSKYIPFGISPQEFHEGDRVKITGHFPNDVYSTCMAGVILRVEKLEKIEEPSATQQNKSQPFIP